MDECHIWNNGSVWHKGWPHNVYSQLCDLHFVVQMILLYILKVIIIDLYYFNALNDGASGGIRALRVLALVRTTLMWWIAKVNLQLATCNSQLADYLDSLTTFIYL